jgi:hypothetical protein
MTEGGRKEGPAARDSGGYLCRLEALDVFESVEVAVEGGESGVGEVDVVGGEALQGIGYEIDFHGFDAGVLDQGEQDVDDLRAAARIPSDQHVDRFRDCERIEVQQHFAALRLINNGTDCSTPMRWTEDKKAH